MMSIKQIYFNLACALLIPIALVSGFFNHITCKAMVANWPNYPHEYTVKAYTPDRFTTLLHYLGPIYIVAIAVGFVFLIGVLTFGVKSKYSNFLNATLLVVGTYVLVTTLAWLLISMSVLARY